MAAKQKKQERPEQPHRLRRVRVIHFLLLAALSVAIYANALRGEFVFDDAVQVVRNESIRSLENLPRAFTEGVWSFADKNNTWNNRYYRPMQTVIFALVYQVAELSPLPYHVASLLLHIAACILIYLLCVELGWTGSGGLLAASFFAVHPVHTEAVSWIAGVTEVACGVFYFGGLLALLRSLRLKSLLWTAVGLGCFLLALFSKEMAATFPVVALVLLRMRRADLDLTQKKSLVAVVPYVVVLIGYLLARVAALGTGFTGTFREHANLLDWLTLEIWMFGRYVRYAFVPYPLVAMPLTPLYFPDRVVSTLVYASVIAAVVLVLVLSRRAIRDGLLWFAMFAVMLTPAFYFKGITGGFIYAERYLYLASFPAVVLVSLFVLRLPPRASAAVAIVLVALSSAAVILRNPDWRSDEVVYSRSVEANPDSLYAWLGLATARTNLGNYSGAENALRKAERLLSDTRYIQLPDSGYRVYLGLGTVAARRNMPDEAKSHLIKALELNPQGENAYTILAGILMNFERNAAAAMPLLKKAIELDPLDDQARDSMGVALYNVGRYEEAVGHFQEALRINPQSELAQQHLQRVMQKLGRR
jgi:hypothetical protein